MVISEEKWIEAIKWAFENEGTDVYEITEEGKFVYKKRNKIKTKNIHEQLIYRFKLQDLLDKDMYSLYIHTRTHKSGKTLKSYNFYLKGKRTFKNKKFNTEKAHLADALYDAYMFDKKNPDIERTE